MKSAFVVVLLALSALAQQQSGSVVAACGPKNASINVRLDESQHPLAQPESGKALVYFVQDIGTVNCLGRCLTTKIGVDGTWVGANQRNSYFAVSVEPGEHHVCTDSSRGTHMFAFAHFTTEAGKTYYFRTRKFGGENQVLSDIDPLDSDQARYLIASYPLSVSHPKP